MMASNSEPGIQLSFNTSGVEHRRHYFKGDAVDNVISLGRLSGSVGELSIQDDIIGGFVTKGRAMFVSPIMSRHHARLIFSDDGVIFLTDSQKSLHGTYITRDGSKFKVHHPQGLRPNDLITFGRTVRKGGQTYEALCARVKLVGSAKAPPFNSFTGHGYGLPADIHEDELENDDDFEVYKDDVVEEIEPPHTHKTYKEIEISDGDSNKPASHYESLLDRYSPNSPEWPSPPGSLKSSDCLDFASPYISQFLGTDVDDLGKGVVLPPIRKVPWRQLNNNDNYWNPMFNVGVPDVELPPLFGFFGESSPPSAIPQRNREISVIEVRDDSVDIIDVDAISDKVEGSDLDISDQEEAVTPTLPRANISGNDNQAITSNFTAPVEETNVVGTERPSEIVASLVEKVGKLSDWQKKARRTMLLNRAQGDNKISALTQKTKLLEIKLQDKENQEVELNTEAISQIEQRKQEILEDIEAKKRDLISDLDIHADDLEFEIDRVMDSVECVSKDVRAAKNDIESKVKDVSAIATEATTNTSGYVKEVEVETIAATEQIRQIIAGVKRKAEEMDEELETRISSLTSSIAEVQALKIDAISIEDGPPKPIIKRRRLDKALQTIGNVVAGGVAVYLALGMFGVDDVVSAV